MNSDFIKLYPQAQTNDRRKTNTPVCFERRSGNERRDKERFSNLLNNETFKVIIHFENQIKEISTQKRNDEIDKKFLSALSPIIPIRRVSSIPDNLKKGNYEKVIGLLTIATVMLPEDTRDLKAATEQISKGKLSKYSYATHQAPFSFFRGTVLEPVVNKFGKFGLKLHQMDTTLASTKLGDILEKLFKFKINELEFQKTGRQVPKISLDDFSKPIIKKMEVYAYKIEGNFISKAIGRALLRIPVISVFLLSLLELPEIVKKVNNTKENKVKEGLVQSLKGFINVSFLSAGIGIVEIGRAHV